MIYKLFLFFLFPFFLKAQITGRVTDSLNTAIPFVNIWVEDLNIGTTSNENGEFEFDSIVKGHFICLYSIGFERKRYLVEQNNIKIELKTKLNELKEIHVYSFKRKLTKKIGEKKIKNNYNVFLGSNETPKIFARYFPYDKSYKQTPYINALFFLTKSEINNSTLSVHLYSVKNNEPGEDLVSQQIILDIPKGNSIQKVDLTNYNIFFPEDGIFVAFEFLVLDKNKTNIKLEGLKKNNQILYSPFLGAEPSNDLDAFFQYINGKWSKNEYYIKVSGNLEKKQFRIPVQLILSN